MYCNSNPHEYIYVQKEHILFASVPIKIAKIIALEMFTFYLASEIGCTLFRMSLVCIWKVPLWLKGT